jgi:chemotaxis protein MotA
MTPKTPAEGSQSSKSRKSGGGQRIDFATIGGLFLAISSIVGGLVLEGGKLEDIRQITAALIVLGGTLGAVMVSTPMQVLKGAMAQLAGVLFEKLDSPGKLIEEIIRYATKARKNGLVSLEQDAAEIADPFLKKAMNLAVDGTDMQELRAMMEIEMQMEESRGLAEAKVFESAGGYAPTIGIIGAVMGLIQVMKNLANIEEVGHGIAVAFVATLYGVGLANVILIPAGSKIRLRLQRQTEMRELILEGVIGIVEGLNPKLILSKLEAYEEKVKPADKKSVKTRAEHASPAAAAN